MSENLVLLETQGPIGIVTLNRPDKLNALELEMLDGIERICARLEADRTIRAVVLTGAGKAFSTGGDIKAWSGMAPDAFAYQWVRRGHLVFARFARLRQPVVAAINGAAMGGGLELAAAADFRIAAISARLGMPETGLGMVPGWSGTQRLVRRFGPQVVRRMVLAGEVFSAGEALALGLVDRVEDKNAVRQAAISYANEIAGRGPGATETAKLMIAAAEGEDRDAAIETLASINAARTDELREGVTAFAEKRAAAFKEDRK